MRVTLTYGREKTQTERKNEEKGDKSNRTNTVNVLIIFLRE